MNLKHFVKISVSVFCLGIFSSSNAAIIDVTRLNIDSITVSFVSNLYPNTPQSDTIIYSPPTVWNMGEYQGVVLNYSILGTPNVNIIVESTSAYGAPPSSGTVDTSLGTIDLNLSDMRMTVSGDLIGNFNLWNASTLTIDANTYNSITGDFVYGWSDNTILKTNFLINTTVDYSILIAGTASTVPFHQLFGYLVRVLSV